MMTKTTWLNNILAIVKCFSSSEYLQRAWIKHEFDYPCHFEELISKLYDDGDFDNFIDHFSKSFNLNKKQIEALDSLRNKLDTLIEREDIYMKGVPFRKVDEKVVLNMPEWKEIQLIAKNILDDFPEYPQ